MTRRKTDWWELPVPLILPQTYLRVAAERGADTAALLTRASLPADFIARPTDLPMLQMYQLVTATMDAVGNRGIGLDVGSYLPPTAFGSFGYALLCSETIADAIELCRKYWHLVARGTQLALHFDKDFCRAEVTAQGPLPPPFDQVVFETTFASVYRGLELLIGGEIEGLEVWFDFPEPEHAHRARALLPDIRYGMPVNQLRFPASLLNVRLSMHNPTGLKFALEQCEREDALSSAHTSRTLTLVRESMVFSAEGYPSLEQVSQKLNMTARTLRRRLDEEGTNFKTLTEEAKRRDAIRLLDDRALDIQRVAALLGYQDPANFTRAFRQWTGETPSQYRQTRSTG